MKLPPKYYCKDLKSNRVKLLKKKLQHKRILPRREWIRVLWWKVQNSFLKTPLVRDRAFSMRANCANQSPVWGHVISGDQSEAGNILPLLDQTGAQPDPESGAQGFKWHKDLETGKIPWKVIRISSDHVYWGDTLPVLALSPRRPGTNQPARGEQLSKIRTL